jgi:hypothetical protein
MEGIEEQAALPQKKLPAALRLASANTDRPMPRLHGSQVDPQRLRETVTLGQQWMEKNFQIQFSPYSSYYLYSLERYKSFEELLTGDAPEEPQWYRQGYELLVKTQKDHGGWQSASGAPCATAFAILFLLRSTQKSIKASLGEGTLVGGRGLSANLSRMKLRHGKLVVQAETIGADGLLAMLEDPENQDLDKLVENSAVLDVEHVGEEQARRLRQIVRSGPPESRQLAVRALARLRRLEYVPSLLYAMTDPDNRVVREARDGLRFISRRFDGFGLKDSFTDRERYDALDKWKQWYRSVQPE